MELIAVVAFYGIIRLFHAVIPGDIIVRCLPGHCLFQRLPSDMAGENSQPHPESRREHKQQDEQSQNHFHMHKQFSSLFVYMSNAQRSSSVSRRTAT